MPVHVDITLIDKTKAVQLIDVTYCMVST